MVATALLRLPHAVLSVSLHRVRDVEVDAVCVRVDGGDEQWVGGRLSQVTRHKAVLSARVAQRRGAGVRRRLTYVGDDGYAVHGLFVVADLQHLQVDPHIGVAHATDNTDTSSPATPWAVGVGFIRTGLMAHRLGAVHFHLLGGGGDLQAIAADFVGGEREGLACGSLEGDSALEGTQRDGQASSGSLRRKPYHSIRTTGIVLIVMIIKPQICTFHLNNNIWIFSLNKAQ